jgi:hypothetical protein
MGNKYEYEYGCIPAENNNDDSDSGDENSSCKKSHLSKKYKMHM